MSKHSSIFSVSIPTREQRTDADKMAFPQPVGGGGVEEEEVVIVAVGGLWREEEGAGRSVVLRGESRRDTRQREADIHLIKHILKSQISVRSAVSLPWQSHTGSGVLLLTHSRSDTLDVMNDTQVTR